jgi:hypothetical protein
MRVEQTMTESECVHCYHPTGVMLCSMPPQLELVCCNCGGKQYVKESFYSGLVGHGPFAPK